jgi:hypothetical protein
MPQVERVSGVGEECGKKSVKHGHKKALQGILARL